MTVTPLRKYVLFQGKVTQLEEFAKNNEWMLSEDRTQNLVDLPENCISIYYYINSETKTVTDKLFMASWHPKYKKDFKEIGLAWVEEYFRVEEADIVQLDTPEENILMPGGEIFTLLNKEGIAVGAAAMIHHDTFAELGKMSVKKEFNGKGYSHPLMFEGVYWAKNNNHHYDRINLYTAKKLLPAVSLYKKYGFVAVPMDDYVKFSRADLVMSLVL